MVKKNGNVWDIPIEILDGELIARGACAGNDNCFRFADPEGTPAREAITERIKQIYHAAPPPDPHLAHLTTPELVKLLMKKARGYSNNARGIWHVDNRMDVYNIRETPVRRNVERTVAVCMAEDLIPYGGFLKLRTKNYGETFNLCEKEPFRNQPAACGRLFTAVLVDRDIVATAGHCVSESNVSQLRFLFGFKMLGVATPVVEIPGSQIYRGVELIGRVYNGRCEGSDWALVRLDREAKGRRAAVLTKETISVGRMVYVLGHPMGLPLKYATGADVCAVADGHFSSPLNVFSGNSGSPVFDRETHQLVGLVVRGDNRDFRWSGKCWISVTYPIKGHNSNGAQCTHVARFKDYCWKTGM